MFTKTGWLSLAFASATALALVCAAEACSSSRPPAAIIAESGADDAAGDAGTGFSFEQLGCGSAGTQSVIAVSGTKIGVASLASTTMTQTCTITPMQGPTTSQVPLWNVCYSEGALQSAFTGAVVTTQPYVSPTGVGMAFDPSGNAAVAYTGVGSTPAMERCGANDAFLARSTGGTFAAGVQVSQGSQSSALVAAQAGNCSGSQNVCDEGDVTGWWPALGFDAQGNAMIAYRDEHFGFSNDDLLNKSDSELAEQQSGAFSVLTVDVSRGAGMYGRLAFTPQGLPVVASYSPGLPAVVVDRALVGGTVAAQSADGGWTAGEPFEGQIGPQLGFAISAQGLMAVAYFDADPTSPRLYYLESTDGSTWSTPTAIDNNGLTGQYPSLAFDSSGNPAIAYYRCSDNAAMTQCDPAMDGLYLARRTGGTWSAALVHADPAVTDGLYPALAFASGHAVIAFQITSYDAASSSSSTSWWIAEEQ